MRKYFPKHAAQSGVTIIELLIVVIILALLSVFTFMYLDPHDFPKKAKDAERKELISQVAKAISIYHSQQQKYPTVIAPKTWHKSLVDEGELRSEPKTQLSTVVLCTTSGSYTALLNEGFCYKSNAARDQYVIYTLLDSKSERSKMKKCEDKANYYMYYLVSTTSNKAGYTCLKNNKQPTPATDINVEDIE